MGNSEVGHNALGCGQVYSQGAKLVGESIENGVLFADNTQLSEDYADLWQPDGIHLLPEFYPRWAANLIFASWGEIADA